jgi:putative (di)nucleoside polyphosphate hydrolase
MSTTSNFNKILDQHDHLYRNGVGIMLINDDKKIFVGKRIDNQSDAWQMPQGGIDAGEDEDFAMFRELQEETGINEKLVHIIKKSENYFYYNLPYKLQKKFWGGKYLGQKQRWYLLKYIGDDSMINIKLIEPEFSEWKWVEKDELLKLIVNFKRELYKNIISEFKNYI